MNYEDLTKDQKDDICKSLEAELKFQRWERQFDAAIKLDKEEK